MLDEEYPALVEYALKYLNEKYDDRPLYTRKTSCTYIIRVIITKVLCDDKKGTLFGMLGVNEQDWLSLYKKTYETIKTTENINEIAAFKIL